MYIEEEGKKYYYLQVECKGSDDNTDRGLGQSLRYYFLAKGLCTFIAIPYNHYQLLSLREIVKILPIGLLVVTPDKNVGMVKETNGISKVEVREGAFPSTKNSIHGFF